MTIKDVLKKAAAGEALTDEERALLAGFDPEAAEGGRASKTRQTQDAAKLQEALARAEALEQELAAARDRVEELEGAGKTAEEKAKAAAEKELSRLKRQVGDLTKERDDARAGLAKAERNGKISALASKHGFANAEYLDFLTANKEIDIDDDGATGVFMKELERLSPELFLSSARSGGGTGVGGVATCADGARTRMDELMKKPALTPREASEVIRLQREISDAGNANQTVKTPKLF